MRDVFGYSRQMKHLLQSFSDMDYSWEEWERIIHEELDNGRPVLYGSETETRVDAFYGKAHASSVMDMTLMAAIISTGDGAVCITDSMCFRRSTQERSDMGGLQPGA